MHFPNFEERNRNQWRKSGGERRVVYRGGRPARRQRTISMRRQRILPDSHGIFKSGDSEKDSSTYQGGKGGGKKHPFLGTLRRHVDTFRPEVVERSHREGKNQFQYRSKPLCGKNSDQNEAGGRNREDARERNKARGQKQKKRSTSRFREIVD